MPAGGLITAGVIAAAIGAVGTGAGAAGASISSKRKLQAAKQETKNAMVSGITDVIKAREAAKLQREANAAKEKATILWILFGLIVVFGVIVTVVLIRRKKQQQ